MSLSPGQKLSHYEIVAAIGKGGMGEVYRARDTKLGRDVAIKVLPNELARDEERLARFEREAKLLAALNHPGVATLHGLERFGVQPCLVMELVEGETLADRIALGPIPTSEAISLFVQIAEGLDAAHEKGIVHRDLKPANIKITPDGRVKILDFGLAKALLAQDDVSVESSQSPTLTKGTALGAILGTASYMSPEQARGKNVDKRADIWAFGCCLYEALTRKKAFDGETVSDIIGSVLRDEPELESLPPGMQRIVRHCLEKDPRLRMRDIGDVRVQLSEAAASTESNVVQTTPWRTVAWALLAGAVVMGAVMALWPSRSSQPPPVSRLHVNLPESQQMHYGDRVGIALSPDGTQIAYVTNDQIYLRALDAMEPTPVPGTEGGGARGPFFSPDGEWLGFWSDGQLQKVRTIGGAPVALCTVSNPRGVSWGDDGFIYFQQPGRIQRVSSAGGTPETIVSVDTSKEAVGAPHILPGGESMLFTLSDDLQKQSRVVVESFGRRERRVLLDGRNPRYLRTGHIVYASGRSLMAVPFDGAELRLSGDPVRVVEGVYWSAFGTSQFTVSDDGTLAYLPFSPEALGTRRTLVWVDREGVVVPEGDTEAGYEDPRISPDGRRLLFTEYSEEGWRIWGYDRERGSRALLAPDGISIYPVWAPEGDRFAFTSARLGGSARLMRMPADGSSAPELLFHRDGIDLLGAFSWSPDGEILAFYETRVDADGQDENIWLLRRSGNDWVPSPFLETPTRERSPMISPDGRFLAYVSDESGQDEVHVIAFPGAESKWVVSTGGGTEPRWSRDGRELFYRNGDQMLVVDVQASGTDFLAERPRLLFEGRFAREPAGNTNYDVTPDGERFLMVRSEEAKPLREITIVLNWYSELERLAPPGQ